MLAYGFYLRDPIKGFELVGILPERRRDPARITTESVTNWGRETWGENLEGEDIFFTRIIVDDSEKVVSGYLLLNG